MLCNNNSNRGKKGFFFIPRERINKMPTLGIVEFGCRWSETWRGLNFIHIFPHTFSHSLSLFLCFVGRRREWAKRASEEKLFRNLCLYITTGCFVEKRDLIFLSLFSAMWTWEGGKREWQGGGLSLSLSPSVFFFLSLVSNANVKEEKKVDGNKILIAGE